MSKTFDEGSVFSPKRTARSYEFGPFYLDAARRMLFRDGVEAPVSPKAIELLLALVERCGCLMETEELMKRVWPNQIVEQNNLTFQVCKLRRALGEHPQDRRYIVTVPRRGYLFAAPVRGGGEDKGNAVTLVTLPITKPTGLSCSFSFTLTRSCRST